MMHVSRSCSTPCCWHLLLALMSAGLCGRPELGSASHALRQASALMHVGTFGGTVHVDTGASAIAELATLLSDASLFPHR